MNAHVAPIGAAGVAAFDRRGRIAVVHRPRYDDWTLPKGKLERSEPPPVAAVRECLEETSTRVRLEAPLSSQSYEIDGIPKTVSYWRAFAVSRSEHTPTAEVDAVRWLEPERATDFLTYDTDRLVLAEAVAIGPTVPLVVLRHAAAVKRGVWRAGDARARMIDSERPLTPDGLLQSDRIADLLWAYAVAHVVTSPARRCRQTVEPYAARLGIRLVVDPALSEEEFSPDQVESVVTGLIAELPRRMAICTHRPVLPHVTHALGDNLRRARKGGRLDPRLRPGRALILHIATRSTVVAVERWHFAF